MPRLTTEWLMAHGACQNGMDAWLASPYAERGCCLADAVGILDLGQGEHRSWLRWLYAHAAEGLPGDALCALAASRARSVEHLWGDEYCAPCERAVALAEAAADGRSVSDADVAEVSEAFQFPSLYGRYPWAGWVAYCALRAIALLQDRESAQALYMTMDAADYAAHCRADPAQGWREAMAELDGALARAEVPA